MTSFHHKSVLILAILLATSGCQSLNTKSSSKSAEGTLIDEQILEATDKIKLTQKELYYAGALNNVPRKRIVDMTDPSQKLTLEWNGDAKELLQSLANQSGRTFVTRGVKLPLPVNVKSEGVTFEEIIKDIQMQVGYRAVIAYTDQTLTVNYIVNRLHK